MSLSSALLGGIAALRFAIRSRTDWLSRTIRTFWGDSSFWIICNAFLVPSYQLERASTMCRSVWHRNGELQDYSGDQQ